MCFADVRNELEAIDVAADQDPIEVKKFAEAAITRP